MNSLYMAWVLKQALRTSIGRSPNSDRPSTHTGLVPRLGTHWSNRVRDAFGQVIGHKTHQKVRRRGPHGSMWSVRQTVTFGSFLAICPFVRSLFHLPVFSYLVSSFSLFLFFILSFPMLFTPVPCLQCLLRRVGTFRNTHRSPRGVSQREAPATTPNARRPANEDDRNLRKSTSYVIIGAGTFGARASAALALEKACPCRRRHHSLGPDPIPLSKPMVSTGPSELITPSPRT